MDRLEQLSQGVMEALEARQASGGAGCLSTSRLEAYLGGDLSPAGRGQVEAHLDGCLCCLNAMVELRDLLHAVASPAGLSPALERRFRSVIPSVVPAEGRGRSRGAVLAPRTVGNYTFELPWVPPRAPGDSSVGALAQWLTGLLRRLDDRLSGGGERARFRRLGRDAGLTVSGRGFLACRRWRWWGWWLVDSVFCGVCLTTWLNLPLTPKMSDWLVLVLLAGGLPWLTVAAMAVGVAVIALAAYLPWAMWNWLGESYRKRKRTGVQLQGFFLG